MNPIPIKNFSIGKGHGLTVMCGPCVIEGEDFSLKVAEQLKVIFDELEIPFIYKSSYDKANRSSFKSFRGPGLEKGLEILDRIRRELDLPVVTDVHSPEEATAAGQVCEVLQIPAFLCRQTDLINAAGRTGAVVSVKKGQFLSPWETENIVKKILETGNKKIILVDRGTSFGYNNLISDMRAIPIMQKFGVPVCFDATHSVQLPGGLGESSGGQKEFVPVLAKAAVAAGADCIFIEAHPNPKKALSDGPNMLSLEELPGLLRTLKQLHAVVRSNAFESVVC